MKRKNYRTLISTFFSSALSPPPCVVLHLGCAVFIHEVEEIMKSVLFITLLKFHCYYSRGILNIGGILVYLRDFVSLLLSFGWRKAGVFFGGVVETH